MYLNPAYPPEGAVEGSCKASGFFCTCRRLLPFVSSHLTSAVSHLCTSFGKSTTESPHTASPYRFTPHFTKVPSSCTTKACERPAANTDTIDASALSTLYTRAGMDWVELVTGLYPNDSPAYISSCRSVSSNVRYPTARMATTIGLDTDGGVRKSIRMGVDFGCISLYPVPSCPLLLSPQLNTSPSSVRTTVWYNPAATSVTNPLWLNSTIVLSSTTSNCVDRSTAGRQS
mmetsp:Transcript_5959/g.14320  ORF Transcript_5959/g.14320 Transcript_5959/m.14320 type:complete len:230 (-) Transcript_5959:1174-1863(-)